jgi:hypothetical protein
MKKLAIAWRNPIPEQHVRRWQAVAKNSFRTVYAVQQLVNSGTHYEWSNTMCLELVHGAGGVSAKERKRTMVGWLLTSIP